MIRKHQHAVPSDYSNCSICGNYADLVRHVCPPVWHVRFDDYDPDESEEVRAPLAHSAAEKYMEDHSGDGEQIGDYDVWVRADSPEAEWKKYEVQCELVPTYRAIRLLKDGEHITEPFEEATDDQEAL